MQLHLRTGVNTGEVVVGGQDGDLIGDPVNVAARLEQAAGAGEVLVGADTERLVRHAVNLEPVEALELKGKAGPVRAFRLVSVAAEPGPAAGVMSALVGRADELGRLRAAFDEAVADRACRLVTVIGSPGIGKTRLADELARSVEGEAVVLRGNCEQTDGGITFAPVIEVLRAAAAIGEGDATEQAREKLTRLLPEGDDREVVVERALGVLGAVPAASTEETFWGVRRVLEALARNRPLVLVLDDVHWGQPTYLDLVEHLVEWVRDAPVLLLALARPELRELRDALASGRRAIDVIELDPLDAADSRTLVDELLGQTALPELLAERVLRATEGNPLFVGETVRMLVDEGVLRREGDAWVAAEDIDVEMPPTVHALIAARLERLGGDERAVVERASVIGKQFYRGAVADLCSYPVGRGIDGHLETLRRKELVQPEGTYWIDEPVFRFHHVLIRDAAYRSVLKEARAELHERFADWLESKAGEVIGEHEEVVAFHLEQAHEYRGQLGPLDERGHALGRRAAERLGSAGRRALARDDLPAATNLLGRALERLDEDSQLRAALLVDLAEALLSAGETHAAAPVVQALRGAAGDDGPLRALAAVYAAQLAYLTDSSQIHDTVEAVAELAEELSALGDEAGVAKANQVQAAALAQLGQVGAAEAALDRALAAARTAGDARRVSAVLAGAPLAALWGPSPVVRASGRCLDVVRILRMTPGNRHLEAAALSCQAVLEAMRGRAEAARAMLDGCRATFEELGLSLALLENEVHAGLVELLDGDAAAAEAPLRSAYEGFAALGAATGTERAAALLARTLLDRGRDDEAAELTSMSEDGAGEDLKATIAWCGVRAEVLARRGEHDGAEELARRGADLAAQTDALTDHADARMALAAVLRAAGRDGDADGEAQRALELYRQKENEAGARRASAFAGIESPATATERPAVAAPAMPAVWERLNSRHAAALNARDREALAAVTTDDVHFVNHRTIATWDQVRDYASWWALQEALWDSAPDARYSVTEFVDGDDVVAISRWRMEGHLESGGGEWALSFLTVGRLRGERLEHGEFFDEDDLTAARACAERLRAEAPDESRNARLLRRWVDAVNARDWDRAEACLTTDFVASDRRALATVGRERDRATFLAQNRAMTEQASDVRYACDLVADLGDLGVIRGRWHGHMNDGGGAFELPVVIVTQRRGDLLHLSETFDVDDDAAWCARLGELLGDRGASLAVAARAITALQSHDWVAFAAVVDDDATQVDRRTVGGGELRGSQPIVDFYVGLVELAPDLSPHLVQVHDVSPNHLLLRFDVRGHSADGGEIEVPYLLVEHVSDGVIQLIEVFDVDDEEAARRRFDELSREEPGSVQRELMNRYVSLYNGRDFDGLREILSPDLRILDHRPVGWGALEGRETFIEMLGAAIELAPDAHLSAEPLALGTRAMVGRLPLRGHLAAGGGEFELPLLLLVVFDDEYTTTEFELFGEGEEAAALLRFEEIGAQTEHERLWARVCRTRNARDWDGLRACYLEEHEQIDHRTLGWEVLRGAEAMVDMFRSWDDVAPDVELWFEVLAVEGEHGVAHMGGRGHAAEGGGWMEYVVTSLATVRDGRNLRGELFDAGEGAAAMARLAELRAADAPVGASATPRELLERYLRAVEARDWEAFTSA